MLKPLRPRLAAILLVLASAGALHATQAPQPFRILITNDDGVRAPGLLAVALALQPLGEITVAAPAENQSGKGHSLTLGEPMYVDRVILAPGLEAYAISATPASCVKVALGVLMKTKPDLVVSGINHGLNLGRVAYVSGTVGAAREAALSGLPAVAASVAAGQTDYAPAAEIVRQVVEMVRRNGLEPGALLNVNVPAGGAGTIKGIQLTRQSRLTGTERFEEQKTPSGRRFFWSVWNEPAGDVEGSDVWAVEHGFAAVTPLVAEEFDPATYAAWKAKVTAK
jgi:5'-nucleotidase